MRVCFLTTSFPSYKGHFRNPFIYNLAHSLVRKGLKVDVICPYYEDSKKKEEIIDSIDIHRFQYFFPLKLQRLTSGEGIPSNLKRSFLSKIQMPLYLLSMLFKSVKSTRKCDIIHAQWVLSGFVGVILKKIYRKPLIISTRGAAVNLALKNKVMRKILIYIFNNCDFIAPNNQNHVEIIRKLGISGSKLKSIPNGVDTKMFKPMNRKKARKKVGLGNNKKIILFIGLLIERKGLRYLLNAMPEILNEHKDVMLVVIGRGNLEREMKDLSKSKGIDNNVLFVGSKYPKTISYWMNAADIFVLPSLSEGRPNVVPEAMSCKQPVIATAVNGTPEFIDNNETGFLIKPKNSHEIAEKILMLLGKEQLRLSIGKKARESIIKKELSWNNCASNFIRLYKHILKKG